MHVGVVSQLSLAKQDTVADPDRKYSLSQLYVTVPPNFVLDDVPGDPLGMEGGVPQSTAVYMQGYICNKENNCLILVIVALSDNFQTFSLTFTNNAPITPCSLRLTCSHCSTRQFISIIASVCSCSSLQSKRASWTVSNDSIGEGWEVWTSC